MESNAIVLVIGIVCLILVGYLIWLDNRYNRMLKLHVRKMNASPMFAEMVPLLKRMQHESIEQLIIDKKGLTIRHLQPAGRETYFSVYAHGYPPLGQESRKVLLVLLEEFLPIIANRNYYSFKKKNRYLLNGKCESYYAYIICNPYKATLVRPPLLREGLQRFS